MEYFTIFKEKFDESRSKKLKTTPMDSRGRTPWQLEEVDGGRWKLLEDSVICGSLWKSMEADGSDGSQRTRMEAHGS